MGGKMMVTKEEKKLLEKLASGALDGRIGRDLTTSGGSTIWKSIKDGIPAMYKQGPGGKFFNGKENERYDGVLHVLEKWVSDDEKLQFLQKFGWLLDDADVIKYSAKFKPKR